MLKTKTDEEPAPATQSSQAALNILEDAISLAERKQIPLFEAISRIGHASTNYSATIEARTLARSLGMME